MARAQIDLTVLDGFGQPVPGAQVTIRQRASTTLAAIWQDQTTVVQLPNPSYTDVYGRLPGWLNRGAYDCAVAHKSIAPYTESIDIAVAGDGSIDTAWIADGAVTANKLDAGVSSAPAAGSVGTTQLANGAVTDVKVANVSGSKLITASVPTAALADGSVTNPKLGALAVTDAKVNDVSGSKLAAASVTGAKIASGTITQTNMATDSVGGAQIAAGAVGTAEIADGSVTSAKLATQAAVPTGTVLDYAGTAAPSGFVFCDGTPYDGTSPTYSALYAVIGTTFGTSGALFRVPDIQGRMVVGRGTNSEVASVGQSDGVTTVANRRPRHSHTGSVTWTQNNPISTQSGGSINYASGSSAFRGTDVASVFVGQAGMTDTPAYIVLNKIIKL
jgi:microcystin-dependent protein